MLCISTRWTDSLCPIFPGEPKIVVDLRKVTKRRFDCHLMIAEPERYVDEFRNAGADIISVHYEATRRAHWLLQHVRTIGARVGLAINP